MNKVFLQFIKLTSYPIEHFYFKKKVYCVDNNKQYRKIKGPALIISNHTSVYDYPLIMYTFYSRCIRTLIAETMYSHSKMLNRLLDRLGGIKVDRKNYDFSFITQMSNCLKKGEVGLIFPESRLHTDKDPQGLLEFKTSYVFISLKNNVPIIPVYTNGIYGKAKKIKKDRAKIIIGKPIIPSHLYDPNKLERDNINFINDYVRNTIIQLGKELESKK